MLKLVIDNNIVHIIDIFDKCAEILVLKLSMNNNGFL